MAKQSLSFLKSKSRFNPESSKRLNLFLFILAFVLLLVFLVHSFESIGQDIGRHLKIGETIWQTHEVPKTNLLSFTEPDFPFINHHWLSEVIFFKVFDLAGFTGLILLKVFLVLVAFLLLFYAIKPLWINDLRSRLSTGTRFWPVVISFLLSLFIFIERTEVRPELFSFVILAFFMFALFRAKYSPRSDLKNPQGRTFSFLWFLPLAQLFWVNLHIYFFIGPFLTLAFLIDRLIASRFDLGDSRSNLGIKDIVIVLFLTLAATLANPSGIQGALLPFRILNEYGYSIVENQTLFFLADFFSFNLSIFVFKLSAGLLVLSLLLTVKKARSRLFEFIVSAFVIYAGLKMLRNLPLYALASFPVMAILLTDIFDRLTTPGVRWTPGVKILKLTVAVLLVLLIFSVTSNSFYERTNSSKRFGLFVPNGLARAISFVKDNQLKGPMFNNFDVGGYLIGNLYPEEKVFVDNRPEAYSVKFFSEIYKPMQENKEKWAELSEKYGINFIFFGHADATPWGQAFLKNIVKDPGWKIVYINENVIILAKNNKLNSGIISRSVIMETNAIQETTEHIKNSNIDKTNLNLSLSRFFYNIDWREPSVHFAEEAIKLAPQNPQAYLYKGLAYAFYTDAKNQGIAEENIKNAIGLGLKDSRNYTILGVVYLNLGRLESARLSFKEALRLDDGNEQAKEFLSKIFNEK